MLSYNYNIFRTLKNLVENFHPYLTTETWLPHPRIQDKTQMLNVPVLFVK